MKLNMKATPPEIHQSLKTQSRFSDIRLDDDNGIPTQEFLDSCYAIVPVLENPPEDDFRPRQIPTLQSIVLHEVQTDVAQVRNSATEALLWLRRGLKFLKEFLSEVNAGQQDIHGALNNAYGKTLRQYHGWVVRGVFALALRAAPSYQSFTTALVSREGDELKSGFTSGMHRDLGVPARYGEAAGYPGCSECIQQNLHRVRAALREQDGSISTLRRLGLSQSLRLSCKALRSSSTVLTRKPRPPNAGGATLPAHGFNLHAGKSKGTVSFHTDNPLSFILAPLHSSCRYRKTKAYPHCSKCAGIQPTCHWLQFVTIHNLFLIPPPIPTLPGYDPITGGTAPLCEVLPSLFSMLLPYKVRCLPNGGALKAPVAASLFFCPPKLAYVSESESLSSSSL
ncbi:hypothetical protein INR49_024174 [Caranx melampygus]|nr:hypothetical protein INR49_024174 [Caranx melampygus]